MDGEGSTPAAEATIRLLATTDLHAAIRGYDYGLRRPDPSRGLSRLTSLARRLRAEVPATIFVDNGDFLYGDTNSLIAGAGVSGVIAAMNAAGYDAALLGNHEFDRGRSPVEEAMRAARFPLLCSNLVRADGKPFAATHLVLERRAEPQGEPIRVGLVGFLPGASIGPGGMQNLGSLSVGGIEDSLRAVLPALEAARADLVVALCHCGFDGDGEESAAALARSGRIDALVLGHVHAQFPGPAPAERPDIDAGRGELAGVPTVMPGFWGRHLGRIDLRLARRDGRWRKLGHEVGLHAVAQDAGRCRARPRVPADPAVLIASRALHHDALEAGGRIVGRTAAPLTSYFARVGLCSATMLVARAQREAVERTLPEEYARAGRPVIGLAASKWGGGRGGPLHYVDIPRGAIVEADLQRLCSFPDRIVGVEATGADLRAWLERSVSAFARIGPGQTGAELSDERFPATDFDLPERVRFRVDLSRPARFDDAGRETGEGAGRVTDLRLDGAPLAEEAEVILALTDYRVRGGGGFPAPAGGRLLPTGTNVRLAVSRLVAAGAAVEPFPSFEFAPVPGAWAVFRTGPGAVRHLGSVGRLGLERIGRDAEGFAAYRLPLGAGP